jgi:hypothetical protein
MPLSVRSYAVEAEPLQVGNLRVTPQSHVIEVRLARRAAFVWHRPTSVRVEEAGQTRTIAIVDVSRMALYSLVALSLVFTLLTARLKRRNA